jgi:hypothetical protein
MKIPFAGEFCPYCLRGKKRDQTRTIAGGIGLILGGSIGNMVADQGGMLVGGLAVGLLATFAISRD